MSAKHTIRDIIIWLISALGISTIYRTILRGRGPLVRVVAFHDIADKAWFEMVISMLVSLCNVVTPEQFRTKEFGEKKINVLITFDDGYHSWIENALPVLEKYGVRALFFINSGLLDVAEKGTGVEEYMQDNLLISPKEPLTWEGAKELVVCGHTIGGHTALHDDLSKLNKAEAEEEIRTDRLRIEGLLDVELSDFAYPFGTTAHYTPRVIEAVQEAGYDRAFTGMPGFVSDQTYEIPRTMFEKDQSLTSVKRWIKGGYDIFSMLKF